jgi:hypothetical protein
MLNQKSQEFVSGHIEGGRVCIVPDGDSEGRIIIDVLLISDQRQECKSPSGASFYKIRHNPTYQKEVRHEVRTRAHYGTAQYLTARTVALLC